jgi:O-methyltransferase involved in polyketide biosynthesis
MQKRKIILNEEKETLLVPLYGKALESKKESPIIYDAMAIEIVGRLNYDFTSLKIPGKTNTMMCLRAKLIDNFVSDFLSTEQKSVALYSTF